MAKTEHSAYQKNIIKNYYEHRDTIMLNKLSELVSELYLATTSAKKKQLWARAEKAMNNLKVPPRIIGHILEKQDPRLLAKHLEEWLAKANK
jgi:hypothetical protein